MVVIFLQCIMEFPNVMTLKKLSSTYLITYMCQNVTAIRTPLLEVVKEETAWLLETRSIIIDELLNKTKQAMVYILEELPMPINLRTWVSKEIIPVTFTCLYWTQFFFGMLNKHVFQWDLSHTKDVIICLKWTGCGDVDRKTTGQELIRNKSFMPLSRLFLAMLYFLEEDAFRIWSSHFAVCQEIDFEVSQIMDNFLSDFRTISQNSMRMLKSYWIHHLQNANPNFAVSHEFWESMFKWCLINGSDVGAQRCWKEMDRMRREACLSKFEIKFDLLIPFSYGENDSLLTHQPISWNRGLHDVAIFIFKQMQETNLKDFLIARPWIYDNTPAEILSFFLRWPYQPLFIANANWVIGYSSSLDHRPLIELIVKRFYSRPFGEDSDYDYRSLFHYVWQHCSSTFKNEFFASIHNRLWLSKLFTDATFLADGGHCMATFLATASMDQKKLFCLEFGHKIWSNLMHMNSNALEVFEGIRRECCPELDILYHI